MAFEIVVTQEAIEDLRRLTARERSMVRSAMEVHLRHEPSRVSRSRIKRLRGLRRPQFRLRIADFRVFYDIEGRDVVVLAVIAKRNAAEWIQQAGEPR